MTSAEGIEYLQKLPADEPVFVLRAQDTYAPSTVGSWAAMCLSNNQVDAQHQLLHPKTMQKGYRAQTLAEEMREWQASHGSKVPD